MLPRSFGLGVWTRPFTRSYANIIKQRENLLRKVYAPFLKLDKNTIEYKELAISGKVWEDYHQPSDSEKQGYTRLQQEYATTLQEIDDIRKAMNPPVRFVAKQLVSEYAHQSVQIEDNHLQSRDSEALFEVLTTTLFDTTDMEEVSIDSLCAAVHPDVTQVRPHADQNQVLELRNHLVASQWISDTASRNPDTAGLGEQDVRALSALNMKDLDENGYYPRTWGGKVRLGDYRLAPISVRSNPLRIFPYHAEVPACMRRFFEWRDRAHQEKKLHPLILACQATAYFVHIHPFPNGNGRVSRMVMHDYMVRQGYLPVVLQAMERQDYLTMISDAQDGNPDEFVVRVLVNQLEALRTFQMREFSG